MSTPPPRRARLDTNPFERRGNGFFMFMVVVVIAIGAAYGIAARRGLYPIAATKSFIALVRGWTGSSAAQLSATEPNLPKTEVPTTPKVEPPAMVKTNPEPPAAAAPKGVAPDSLPAATTARSPAPAEPAEATADAKAAKATLKAVQKSPSAPPPAKAEKAEKAEPVAAAPPAPKPVQPPAPAPPPVAAPAPQAPEPTGLAGAIKKAAGPIETAAPPQTVEAEHRPAPIRGDIPETPPQGAIQGAIGMQRGAARSCVEGHDAPSRATIVFASTGKVQEVSVSGPAAGTDAGRCIVRALSKASVGPFRRPTFSVSTTVSPP